MRRREFIMLACGAAAAWPLAARAQQPAVPVVGFVHTASPGDASHFVTAFRQGLKETGLVEGQNVAVEYRWAQRQHDRLPELYADLVRRQVAVIVAAGGEPSPQVAKAATQTIPIVFTANNDPVRQGLVASLNQPGGNVTGITIFGAAAVTKRLQLLHELVPQTATFAYLVNPNSPNRGIELGAAETAAHSLGMEMFVINAGSEREIDTAFATMDQHRAGALLVASGTFFWQRRDQLSSLAARHRIPAIYYLREFAQAGGLITYGNSVPDMYRQVGIYTGRILKGEKPADLPVQQASKFDLVINLKTAKTLGLIIPPGLLVAADEVIEWMAECMSLLGMAMRRRDFIKVIAGAAAWPFQARAQQQAMPVIGFLNSGSPGPFARNVAAFRQALKDAGYIEGQNMAIEYRWAEGQTDRLPAMASDLVRRQVAVIVAPDSASALAAKAAASATIPVIFLIGGDPIKLGLVASFNRPGRNITGVSVLFNTLVAKEFEALHEAIPKANLIGLLANPTNPNAENDTRDVQAAADTLGKNLVVVKGSTEIDLETAFVTLAQRRTSALVVTADPFFINQREKLLKLAVRHTLPAIYPMRDFVDAGGLMSYGTSLADGYRQVGVYAGRILKDEKPGDLPVQQSTKVELIINLKTAKALGITVPNTLIGRADEVIE